MGAAMARCLLCAIGLWLSACASAAPVPQDAHAMPRDGTATTRPVPPADLDARLIQYYPLRGRVLSESGFARVSFTVAASGSVATASEALKANHPAYAAACRRMLEASTWTPARDASDRAVPYTGAFDCVFEQSGPGIGRATFDASVTPPVQPDYGKGWFERYGGGHIGGNSEAELQIEVRPDGTVGVLGMLGAGNPEVAAACQRMLESGPRWRPATDKTGKAVRYESSFVCRVNLEVPRKELALADVGAAGPLAVQDVAAALSAHLGVFTHCFESAFSMTKKVHGKHWLAFEIGPTGAVGRVEWVEQPLADEMLESCVFSALGALRFPAAAAPTLADVQLEAGGVARITFTL